MIANCASRYFSANRIASLTSVGCVSLGNINYRDQPCFGGGLGGRGGCTGGRGLLVSGERCVGGFGGGLAICSHFFLRSDEGLGIRSTMVVDGRRPVSAIGTN